MYLLLILFLWIFPAFKAAPFAPRGWMDVAPFICANLLSLGLALRPGRFERALRTLVFLDLGLMAVGVVVGCLVLFAQRGFLEGERPFVLGAAAALAVGAVLAWRIYHRLPLPKGLMPVTGNWARRLVAVVSVVLLQPISPGVFVVFALGLPDYARGPADPSFGRAVDFFYVTAPFYFAPLFRFLMAGKAKREK